MRDRCTGPAIRRTLLAATGTRWAHPDRGAAHSPATRTRVPHEGGPQR